jgi:hypothetical protein
LFLGSGAGGLERDSTPRAAAARGRQGFAGLPGFIVHAYGRDHLDDTSNQAQNFVVYHLSAAAAAALRERGGFDWYNERNVELWQLSRQLDLPGVRGFQRLLNERVPRAHARLSARERALVERMQVLLDDPFYAGFTIYVHPHGVRPVGWHLVRLLDRNPRTPFRIELALHNVYGTLFERWVRHRLQRCTTQAGARESAGSGDPGARIAAGGGAAGR